MARSKWRFWDGWRLRLVDSMVWKRAAGVARCWLNFRTRSLLSFHPQCLLEAQRVIIPRFFSTEGFESPEGDAALF